MLVLEHPISSEVETIFRDLKSDMKINYAIRPSNFTRVSQPRPHNYVIEVFIDKSDTQDDIGSKFIHEFSHVYQFEHGYPKIESLGNDANLVKLCSFIDDFVLDTDVNIRFRNKYSFKQSTSLNLKYEYYSSFVDKLDFQRIPDLEMDLLVIECLYIYFNESTKKGTELANHFGFYRTDFVRSFNNIRSKIPFDEFSCEISRKTYENILTYFRIQDLCILRP